MWTRSLTTSASLGPAVARLSTGIILFPHGAQHLLGWFNGRGFGPTMEWMTGTLGFPAPLAVLAIVTEFVAPIALVLGFGSRLAALGVIGIMLGALSTHLQDGFFMNWFGRLPAGSEGFEYHLIMIALAATVVLEGGGQGSLDRVLTRRGESGRRTAADTATVPA